MTLNRGDVLDIDSPVLVQSTSGLLHYQPNHEVIVNW